MPAPRLPWIKFWPEALEHEKFAQLSDAESWTWVVVWAKASLQPKRWRFASVEHAYRVTGRPKAHIRRLVESGLLDEGPDGVVIHDARYWQDAEKITPSHREGWPKDDPSLIERPAKADGKLTNRRSNNDVEGEEDRERDVEGDGEEAGTPSVPKGTSPPRGRRQRKTAVTDELCQLMEDEFWEAFGSRQAVRDVIDHAMGHKARLKCTDQRAYLRNWVRDDAEKAAVRRNGRGGLSLVSEHSGQSVWPLCACGEKAHPAEFADWGKCRDCHRKERGA